MLEKQTQSAGAESSLVQAGRDVLLIQNGITVEQAWKMALDLYQANFPQLVAEAREVARARAEELTNHFLEQLSREYPDGLAQATSPDFQNALLNAQKEHACAGDKDLADLLVDLLVDRTKQGNRDLIQLVLDEALKTAPKLTDAQLATLAVIFLTKYVTFTVPDLKTMLSRLESMLVPVLKNAEVTQSTFQHLQFTGCGHLQPFTHGDLKNAFAETYPAFFQRGFTAAELEEQGLSDTAKKYIIPLQRDPSRKQVGILNVTVLTAVADREEWDQDTRNKLNHLLVAYRLPPEEIQQQLLETAPFLGAAFDLWTKENLGAFQLTSVGLALGHAVVKKNLGAEFAPLQIWIK